VSIEYIRETYGVPAKRGGRIEYTGGTRPLPGTICGAKGQYLSVRLDGAKHPSRFHPTWNIRYLSQETQHDHA
jgi:hypothetical protein